MPARARRWSRSASSLPSPGSRSPSCCSPASRGTCSSSGSAHSFRSSWPRWSACRGWSPSTRTWPRSTARAAGTSCARSWCPPCCPTSLAACGWDGNRVDDDCGRRDERRGDDGPRPHDGELRRADPHSRDRRRHDLDRRARLRHERGPAAHRAAPLPLAVGGHAVRAGGEKVVVDVTQRFGDLVVLDHHRFRVSATELVCVPGKRGCGKTTVANLLAGLLPCSEGTVTIDGVPTDPRRHELAFVFQEPSLWPWRTVRDNIRIGLEIKRVPTPELERRVAEMIELVGLRGFEAYYPYQISGGMKQRVAIARAFAVDADLILMDEPFAALDEQTRHGMQAEVLRIWERKKTTVVFVTHNLEEAIYLAERIIVLTEKPARIKASLDVELPRPRHYAHPGFIALRKPLGELMGSAW